MSLEDEFVFQIRDEKDFLLGVACIAEGLIYCAGHSLGSRKKMTVFGNSRFIPSEGIEMSQNDYAVDIATSQQPRDGFVGFKIYNNKLKGGEDIIIPTINPDSGIRVDLIGRVSKPPYDEWGRIDFNVEPWEAHSFFYIERIKYGMSGSPILVYEKVVGLVTDHWQDTDSRLFSLKSRGWLIKKG